MLLQVKKIHQQISEGKNIEYQLLYSSARDGLNIQAYWAKCDMQQNLLTVMTSKNGSKFGGYSPCQINQSLNNWAQDPTMKSFIFQYNKKGIYELKNKELFIVNRVMDLHMVTGIYMLLQISKLIIHILQDHLMIYQVIILLIRLIIFLEIRHHNYRIQKFIRLYSFDIIYNTFKQYFHISIRSKIQKAQIIRSKYRDKVYQQDILLQFFILQIQKQIKKQDYQFFSKYISLAIFIEAYMR